MVDAPSLSPVRLQSCPCTAPTEPQHPPAVRGIGASFATDMRGIPPTCLPVPLFAARRCRLTYPARSVLLCRPPYEPMGPNSRWVGGFKPHPSALRTSSADQATNAMPPKSSTTRKNESWASVALLPLRLHSTARKRPSLSMPMRSNTQGSRSARIALWPFYTPRCSCGEPLPPWDAPAARPALLPAHRARESPGL